MEKEKKDEIGIVKIVNHWFWGMTVHMNTTDGCGHCKLSVESCNVNDGYISDLVVNHVSRGEGYGKMLLHSAEDKARLLNLKRVYLWVSRDSWMEAWCRREGYKVTLEKPFIHESVCWMFKEL